MRTKVMIFFDGGVDDTMALLYALLHPQLEVIGIVGGFGNVPRHLATRNARFVLEQVGCTHINVFEGADKPMTGVAPRFYPNVHGPEGLGELRPTLPTVPLGGFCEAMQLIKQHLDEVVIVEIGRYTSLAAAHLFYGDVMRKVRAIYLMGGAFLVPGNVTLAAEANLYGDPVAANIVFEYVQRMTLFPLNVTNKAIVTKEMVDYIESQGKLKWLRKMFDTYATFYQKLDPSLPGPPIHDLFPLFALVHDQAFQYVSKPIQVQVTPGPAYGQTLADFRPGNEQELEGEGDPQLVRKNEVRIALDVDYPLFFQEYLRVMT